MLSKIYSATTIGLDGVLIEVEVDVANRGFPTLTIVGLPTKAVDEAKDRVRTAIVNASYDMPDSRITVNLAPADIPKSGASFDLPIALGILKASGQLSTGFSLDNSLFVGELSLEGKLRRVPGVISYAVLAHQNKIGNLYVPVENAEEACLIGDVKVYGVKSLKQLIDHLTGKTRIIPYAVRKVEVRGEEVLYDFDFADVKGQEHAKRALEIAACGYHNIHLTGSPGAGKTMLSRAFPSILPPLAEEEALEVAKIYSVVGIAIDGSRLANRPFRSPHHTTSRVGLIGGGSNPTPGEISLAHRGVLFLDEFAEFPRSVLEALRQPLEDGKVTISRASGTLTFPSRFLLLAASNPCPCGYLGHAKKTCRCPSLSILSYKKKLSGPLLDRIDIHLSVPPVDEEKLLAGGQAEKSEVIRDRIIIARKRQEERLRKFGLFANSEMSSSEIRKICNLTDEANTLLRQAISKFSLSARAYFKIVKIAQTIADLEVSERIEESFIAEALQYRSVEE